MKNVVKILGLVFSAMLLLSVSCDTPVPESQNTVSVSGIGSVSVQPDMVQINVSFSHVAPTTREAKRVVDETMQRILTILSYDNIAKIRCIVSSTTRLASLVVGATCEKLTLICTISGCTETEPIPETETVF